MNIKSRAHIKYNITTVQILQVKLSSEWVGNLKIYEKTVGQASGMHTFAHM